MTVITKPLTLVGMSNCGKTTLSLELQKLGYKRFFADSELISELGLDGEEDLANWLGLPYEDKYQKNSKLLLDLEAKITKKLLLDSLLCQNKGIKTVIDTSGSFAHAPDKLIKLIKKHSKIVYLGQHEEAFETMFERFVKIKKALVCGNKINFEVRKTEYEDTAWLKNKYSDLLTFRSLQYTNMADKIVYMDKFLDSNLTTKSFLESLFA